MGPPDGSCQKLRNCVHICQSYVEKTVALFFSGHGVHVHIMQTLAVTVTHLYRMLEKYGGGDAGDDGSEFPSFCSWFLLM